MMIGGEPFWRCRLCGEKRPDSCISVHKRDVSHEWGLPEGSAFEHVTYCNDRPECTCWATTHRLPLQQRLRL